MATNCTDTTKLYDDVEFCPGQIVLPGTRDHAYFCSKRNIAKWPTLPLADAESLDKVAVYDGDFKMELDKVFARFDLVPSESEPKCEQVGSWGSLHFQNTITLVLPGTGEKVTGLITMMNNDDGIIVVPMRDGKLRVFGSESFNVSIKPSQSMGKGSGDSVNTTIEVVSEDLAPAPFYPGKLPTNLGNINGTSDTLIEEASEGVGG